MKIPASVIKTISKRPMDNDYFYHAEDAYSRLKEIRFFYYWGGFLEREY